MKLLLDQGLPRSTVGALAQFGLVTEHVGDLGLATATDETLLIESSTRGAAIVTFDADFHRLLATSKATAPSVIRIRAEGLKGDQLAVLIANVVSTAKAELASGAVVSATEHRIRIRLLPLRTK